MEHHGGGAYWLMLGLGASGQLCPPGAQAAELPAASDITPWPAVPLSLCAFFVEDFPVNTTETKGERKREREEVGREGEKWRRGGGRKERAAGEKERERGRKKVREGERGRERSGASLWLMCPGD